MDKPPERTDKAAPRKSTLEKLPPLDLAPPKPAEDSQPGKEKQVVAGKEPAESAAALERIEKNDDGERDVYQRKKKDKELTPGEKETVIKGRGLILTEDKEGYEFMYDMLTGMRATVRPSCVPQDAHVRISARSATTAL